MKNIILLIIILSFYSLSEAQNQSTKVYKKPILSESPFSGLRIGRSHTWGYFNNDSLNMIMHFPDDPYSKNTLLFNKDSSEFINTVQYIFLDSINEISYSIEAGLIYTSNWSIDGIIQAISNNDGFRLINKKKELFYYNETTFLEFYIGSGKFRRYQISITNNILYLMYVESSKQKIYSDLAQYFFSGIHLKDSVNFQKLIENEKNLTLNITGSILNNNKDTITSYQIYVVNNGDTTYFDFIDERKFEISLTLGHNYIIGFKKDGFLRKHLSVNLVEHGTFKASQYGFGFPMDLTLQEGDEKAASKHVATLRFNPFTGYIDHK